MTSYSGSMAEREGVTFGTARATRHIKYFYTISFKRGYLIYLTSGVLPIINRVKQRKPKVSRVESRKSKR